ncbi:MAG: permease [Spirochaetaceae bacterium]|nr:MAG: permease [Spirochaetaceae bacterium]
MRKNPRTRYLVTGATIVCFIVFWIVTPDRGLAAVRTIGMSLRELLLVIPPIFVLLGLLDVWVSRERLMRYLGPGAGVRGTLIVFVMGSAAAGPLYAAFPIATVLMQKGSSFFNVMVFIGAWSTTKIPMLLFEYTALGHRFALTRLAANIPAILLMSFILSRIVSRSERIAASVPDAVPPSGSG